MKPLNDFSTSIKESILIRMQVTDDHADFNASRCTVSSLLM